MLWARLRAPGQPQCVSAGALVHILRVLRAALRVEDERGARELFMLLLERIGRLNRQWAGRVVARTPKLRGATGEAVREDLTE